MQNTTEQAAELLLEQELLRNERVIDHPRFGRVRLKRPTPRQARMIAEARRQQYHKDLRDKTILSKAELEKEAIERGIWSVEKKVNTEKRLERVGELMGLLDVAGYEGTDQVLDAYQKATARLLALFEEKSEVIAAIVRYFNLDLQPQPEDDRLIRTEAPSTEVDEVMEECKQLRNQLELLHDLGRERAELRALQEEYARLVKDSIEARMDVVEEMAKIYYCTLTEDGSPLWPDLDSMWDADPYDIDRLAEEIFFFENGISPEYRKLLGRHGFTQRVPDTSDSSESSPEHPQPNSSGDLPDSEPSSSSNSTESL